MNSIDSSFFFFLFLYVGLLGFVVVALGTILVNPSINFNIKPRDLSGKYLNKIIDKMCLYFLIKHD